MRMMVRELKTGLKQRMSKLKKRPIRARGLVRTKIFKE
jgi:hypothetical protein